MCPVRISFNLNICVRLLSMCHCVCVSRRLNGLCVVTSFAD